MNNSSHTSLPIPDGRDTIDVFADDRQETERRLSHLQDELRISKQTVAKLAFIASGDDGQKLVDLASENSKIQAEMDLLLVSKERMETQHREALQKKSDEIEEIKIQLAHTEAERDRYLRRCRELEQRLADEESRFYQQELDGQTIDAGNADEETCKSGKHSNNDDNDEVFSSATQQDRVQQKINELAYENSQLNSIFNRMDQTDLLATSIMNQTQNAAEQLDKHAKRLSSQHSNMVALYDQLKHTAKFLADIVHSIGLNDDQIDLFMQKINKLQLDLKESNEVSVQIANETKQLAAEMFEVSVNIEQSIRQSTNSEYQSNLVNNQVNTKAFDDLLLKNEDLTKRYELLTNENEDLKQRVDVMEENCNKLQTQSTSLTKAKRELVDKLENAMKLAQDRDEELKNRQDIIEKLKQVSTNNGYSQIPSPDQFKEDIVEHLKSVYTTLSSVHYNLQRA